MIKSFKHKGLKLLFEKGVSKGINPQHTSKIQRQLAVLNRASEAGDVNIPGWNLHKLSGDLSNHWSIKVSGNWRLTFMFENEDVILLDYQDYH